MLKPNIDRWFFVLSLLCGLGGMILGIVMGIREDFSLAPVHAHVNLVGFVTLALFGLAYRVGWAQKDNWALAHFALAAPAALLMPVGIYIALLYKHPQLAIVASLMALGSMALCLVNCLRSAAPAAQLL